jgi:heme/copper-type cytochrome/quinol oxidase subunit 2
MKLREIVKLIPLGGAVVVVAALAVTACGSGSSAIKPLAPTTLTYKVVGPDDGLVGSDGKKHDTFYALSGTSVQVGQEVTISIANYDDMPHSFTSPELGLNIMIPPAKGENDPSVTTYTVTPSKMGRFRWYCAIPCDSDTNGWAMKSGPHGIGQDDFLAGYISVTD